MAVFVAVILSVLVGVAVVVQNGTNAELMKSANLWLLLAVGNLLAAFGAAAVFLLERGRGPVMAELAKVPLVVLLPGFCGLVITAAMPVAMAKIGVFTTLMLVIACQILAGIAWDHFYTGESIDKVQLLGAGLVAVGVLLVLRPGK